MLRIPTTQLIDATNIDTYHQELINKISSAKLIGIDIETAQPDAHDGIKRLNSQNKTVFDTNRTTLVGLSLYIDEDNIAYYFNLSHADQHRRLSFDESLRPILAALPSDAHWIAHNAPFEITMLNKTVGFDLGRNVICTLQLAVSCFNDDTYTPADLRTANWKAFEAAIVPGINSEFFNYRFSEHKYNLTKPQSELLYKVIAKESDAAHSYMGLVKSIAFGYGLKKLSKKFLNYEQGTYKDTLQGKEHLGQLEAWEVAKYGADDAWVVVKLYHKLIQFLGDTSPEAVRTFWNQELPMIHYYADLWKDGIRTDRDQILAYQDFEREQFVKAMRDLKAAVRDLLPFPVELNKELMEIQKWYKSNGLSYRERITEWALSEQIGNELDYLQISSAVTKKWAEELGMKLPKNALNPTHYMPARILLYDLGGLPLVFSGGKLQSDKEARAKLINKSEPDTPQYRMLDAIERMGHADQTIKLFITNFLDLVDPDTDRMYPVLSSRLNTRRMALSFPNVSQLPKGKGAAYVRSFFKPDNDHIMVTADWSAIELVIIGELSQDRGFIEAYGQLPHADLHSKAAAGIMGLSMDEFKELDPKDRSQYRKDIGKGANFNYWYSGALGTVAERMGWDTETMWEKSEEYRKTFPDAEQERVKTIDDVRRSGEVTLLDGHKRYRFEATEAWKQVMLQKLKRYGPHALEFGKLMVKKLQSRAGNQAVNAKVQGTCATMAKRTIKNMGKVIEHKGYRARFMFPVHDELIYSVHKDDVFDFIGVFRKVMCHHPSLFKTMKLDASVSIGLNYGKYDAETNPYGQIEIDELTYGCHLFDVTKYGQALRNDDIHKIIEYMGEKA